MTITGIITAIIIGAIIGALGRLVIPGKQNIPIWLTIVIGIVAAFIGTFIARAFGRRQHRRHRLDRDSPAGHRRRGRRLRGRRDVRATRRRSLTSRRRPGSPPVQSRAGARAQEMTRTVNG